MVASHAAPTLLADLGGTNVRFAISYPDRERPMLEESIRRYHVADFGSLGEAAAEYLRDTGLEASRAIIAAAGRIVDNESVKITNNPWQISSRELAAKLKLESVHLVNDFAAQSMAVLLLQPKDLVPVGPLALPEPGHDEEQTFVIVGPGTGLGVGGLLLRPGGRSSILQTEGGHAGFAAHTAEDIEILRYLNVRFGRVSSERLLSGQGLVNLYDAICAIQGKKAEALKPEDVTRLAETGADALCEQALETFAGIFGSVSGDLVLGIGGWNGVYLTGGMIPILLPWVQKGLFRQRFEAKGRFQETMAAVPTQAIMNPEPGLVGCAAMSVAESGGKLMHRFD